MSRSGSRPQVWLKREIQDLQPVVRTSLSFPLEAEEVLQVNIPVMVSGVFRATILEHAVQDATQMSITAPSLVGGSLRALVRTYDSSGSLGEYEIAAPQVISGTFRIQVKTGPDTDESLYQVQAPSLLAGQFSSLVITHTVYDTAEYVVQSPALIGGSFERV